MKKVGIVTIKGDFNFGNKLQNYALIKKISDLTNYEVYTIWPKIKFLWCRRFLKSFLKKQQFSREKNFIEFNKLLNIATIKNKGYIDSFDYIEIGSDQVWNTSFPYFDANLFLGDKFIDCKKFSYAASFGIDDINNDIYSQFKKSLKNFNSISVRENQGIKILNKIDSNLKAKVLIDPTMLLTEKEWEQVIKKPKMYNGEKYILNYFLGNMSDERKNMLNHLAQENNCKIINVMDKLDSFYSIGPSEFLYLEKNAFLICTDSFHSCVFAFLFNKPFVVFDREDHNKNMNSRIDTLISTFNLKDRKYNGKEITKQNLNCDYTEAYKILEIEIKKSEEFLKKALDAE